MFILTIYDVWVKKTFLFPLFSYKLRDEFAADVRLMFNNCQVFNEDESEVGQAGFILRSFFEKRWKELGCSS